MTSILERALAFVAVLCVTPVVAIAALLIRLEDGGPAFFKQVRVGRNNCRFVLLKLRSMRAGRPGSSVTSAADPRITRVGRVVRKLKIYELPQLWNVVRGDMSLIGPRPEVPEYVNANDPLWLAILEHKPGIASLAALAHRNEEQELATCAAPEKFYREVLLPSKLKLDAAYERRRSLLTDFQLLLLTVRYSFVPAGFNAQRVERRFLKERQA